MEVVVIVRVEVTVRESPLSTNTDPKNMKANAVASMAMIASLFPLLPIIQAHHDLYR